jgi:hypothetical protein
MDRTNAQHSAAQRFEQVVGMCQDHALDDDALAQAISSAAVGLKLLVVVFNPAPDPESLGRDHLCSALIRNQSDRDAIASGCALSDQSGDDWRESLVRLGALVSSGRRRPVR